MFSVFMIVWWDGNVMVWIWILLKLVRFVILCCEFVMVKNLFVFGKFSIIILLSLVLILVVSVLLKLLLKIL